MFIDFIIGLVQGIKWELAGRGGVVTARRRRDKQQVTGSGANAELLP